MGSGNSLAIQWLGLEWFHCVPVDSVLVRELRFHRPGSVVKKKKRKFGYIRQHGASPRITVTLKVTMRKTKAVETLINAKYYSEF